MEVWEKGTYSYLGKSVTAAHIEGTLMRFLKKTAGGETVSPCKIG